jgi:hypothetical protein
MISSLDNLSGQSTFAARRATSTEPQKEDRCAVRACAPLRLVL